MLFSVGSNRYHRRPELIVAFFVRVNQRQFTRSIKRLKVRLDTADVHEARRDLVVAVHQSEVHRRMNFDYAIGTSPARCELLRLVAHGVINCPRVRGQPDLCADGVLVG